MTETLLMLIGPTRLTPGTRWISASTAGGAAAWCSTMLSTVQSAAGGPARRPAGRPVPVVEGPDSVARLIQAAIGAFAERGFHATTTRDIASNIDEVATQAGEVSGSVSTLSRSSARSCAGAVRVIWSAKSLSEAVSDLKTEAEDFLRSVRG